jgi:hypothetical protein
VVNLLAPRLLRRHVGGRAEDGTHSGVIDRRS